MNLKRLTRATITLSRNQKASSDMIQSVKIDAQSKGYELIRMKPQKGALIYFFVGNWL